MTRLTIFDEAGAELATHSDGAAIAAELATIGVRFERWPTSGFEDRVEALRADGYTTIDMVGIAPDHPDRAKMRQTFLSEHRHAEDEVRFFVEGAGLFTLREGGRVYAVLCEGGDMISVPAGMRHWFDMGEDPAFCAIRLFGNESGWVASFTGDMLASNFPSYDQVRRTYL